METKNTNVDLNERDREELRLLYNVSASDIASFKQQQWSVTSHALALHAAFLFVAYQLLASPLVMSQLWLLIVLTWAGGIAGLAMVPGLQGSILGRGTRLARGPAQFRKPFND